MFLSLCLLSQNSKIRIYRTVILPVILYGCGTWGENRQRFWNRVMGSIFGPKRDEVVGISNQGGCGE
jgi:hypothetical protein